MRRSEPRPVISRPRPAACRRCRGQSGAPAISDEGARICHPCLDTLTRAVREPDRLTAPVLGALLARHGDVVRLVHFAPDEPGVWVFAFPDEAGRSQVAAHGHEDGELCYTCAVARAVRVRDVRRAR